VLYKELITVCSENQAEHLVSAPCGQNVLFV